MIDIIFASWMTPLRADIHNETPMFVMRHSDCCRVAMELTRSRRDLPRRWNTVWFFDVLLTDWIENGSLWLSRYIHIGHIHIRTNERTDGRGRHERYIILLLFPFLPRSLATDLPSPFPTTLYDSSFLSSFLHIRWCGILQATPTETTLGG
jgi:hypothetical protein